MLLPLLWWQVNSMNTYRIKTASGYAYTTGRGRYGRFDGSALEAAFFCQTHAQEQVQMLREIAPELGPEIEEVNGTGKCILCHKEERP